jgi:hypothetical protein
MKLEIVDNEVDEDTKQIYLSINVNIFSFAGKLRENYQSFFGEDNIIDC